VFSALEVVPLVLAGYEAWRISSFPRGLVGSSLQVAVYFFLSVAFWNAVGAGLFGFMINPRSPSITCKD